MKSVELVLVALGILLGLGIQVSARPQELQDGAGSVLGLGTEPVSGSGPVQKLGAEALVQNETVLTGDPVNATTKATEEKLKILETPIFEGSYSFQNEYGSPVSITYVADDNESPGVSSASPSSEHIKRLLELIGSTMKKEREAAKAKKAAEAAKTSTTTTTTTTSSPTPTDTDLSPDLNLPQEQEHSSDFVI